MTKAQIAKARILRAKIEAGIPVRETEWPAWMRPRRLTYEDDRNEWEMREEYLRNKGITEDQANPAAINWDAYHARERGGE